MELKKYKLGEILELQRGYDLPSSKIVHGNVPVAGSNGIIGYHNTAKIQPPCITIGRSGSVGKVHYYEEPIWPHNTSLYVKDFKGNVEKYVYYLLRNIDLSKLCDSSVVPSLNRNFVYPITISFFDDIEYQRKIASVLSSLDNKIALNRRINAKLEQIAKRLYDYWFVQFDFPFDFAQGKPNAEGKPYKSSGGKMVWNDKLKREVPEGWEVKKLEDTLKCDISGDWGEEQTKGNHTYKVNCIRGCDMVNMTNLPERYIIPKNADKLLETNDFVIEISGGSPSQSTGRIVQITEEIINRFNKKVICSNFCHGIRLKEANLVSYFLQTWNTFYKNGVFFNYEGKTSGLKNFQFDSFFSNYWYFPPMELARQYHETYSKIKEKIDKTETEITKLTALRDKLLPLLMNGQVEVKG